MLKINLLVPTRSRPKYLKELFLNLAYTIPSFRSNHIELFLKIDEDDIETKKAISILERNEYPFNWHYISNQKSDFLNRDYYNNLSSIVAEGLLWGIADDVRFFTDDWYKSLTNKVEEYLKDKPDRIAYISVNEEGSTAKHPCFPLITKEAFQVLGEYHCSELLSWGSDRILWEIYSGIGRTLHIPEISIKHLSYHDGSAPFDETAKSMKERFFRNPNAHNLISETKVPQQIEKLKKYIEEFNKNA
jgi:hypothetical protein